jgi:transcriptional regulator with PAS, ATPase and Fis domain
MVGKMEGEQVTTSDSAVMDLEEMEKQMIIRALKRTGNNKARAAEMLNISWQSLDRRMKKFGI